MSEIGEYWRSIIRDAWADVTSELMESPMSFAIALIGHAIGISLLLLIGDSHGATGEIILRAAAWGATLGSLPILFIYNLLRTSAVRDTELRAVIAGLQKQAAGKQHHLAVQEQLATLWSEGSDLLPISEPGEELELAAKKVEWGIKVEKVLTDANLLDEAVGFKTINDYPGKINKLRKIWMRAAKRASE